MMLLKGPGPWRPRRMPTPSILGRARPPMPQVLCVKLCGNLKYCQSHLYSTVVPPDEITISYRHGLPLITLTLPSRKERCQFVVKPMSSTVGSFLQDLQNEDKGVKTAAIFTADGSEIAGSTLMEILLMNDFKVVINKVTYDVRCPKKEKLNSEHTTEMENMKSLVHRLFTALHLEEFQKKREHQLLEKIDHLKGQLQPLEEYTGAPHFISLRFIVLRRYCIFCKLKVRPSTSKKLMTHIKLYDALDILQHSDYTYSAIKTRQFLHYFHKKSKQQHFDVVQYNKLKEDLAKAKESLSQVRRSLYLPAHIEELNEEN
ncbi:calcium uniporter regulatory subunit MCUb, mitochondrial [Pteropus vampyrus]|uniref:Calcium uniporter protein n=1 Tax=Pteropus vampyrus TaxID=132908 RepID=A0A6P3QG70_PTEVA|nr:calcium uniporter regulatory subunit MCUb, mitochondrial [Pteropus vampyrus]